MISFDEEDEHNACDFSWKFGAKSFGHAGEKFTRKELAKTVEMSKAWKYEHCWR